MGEEQRSKKNAWKRKDSKKITYQWEKIHKVSF
jgi:hypothetical protein